MVRAVRPVVEVFADVSCPFTHVGLRRFVERRAAAGRQDVLLRIRAWPLEIVNGHPLDATFVGEEVDEVRDQVAPALFRGFSVSSFPSSSIPAFATAAAAYRAGDDIGEAVSLHLRDLLFEEGEDISDRRVLERVAATYQLEIGDDDLHSVEVDHTEGKQRGVIGSPHFFTATGSFFCPALDISRNAAGHLRVVADPTAFEAMMAAALAPVK